jgi:deoxyribodipyrimidine photo-lyase
MVRYTLFIYRRDLRVVDNNGLHLAMKEYDHIIPIFIFTPEQVGDKNKFKSNNAIQFMCESLKELDSELRKNGSKLHIFRGENINVLKKIINTINVENIVYNMDYTPYAKKRDKSIRQLCNKKNIICLEVEDYLINKVGTILKPNGEPYTIFTPFKNKGLTFSVSKPSRARTKNLIKVNKLNTSSIINYEINNDILVKGGRSEGIKMLKKLKHHKNYGKVRNLLSVRSTELSAYIKFGCVSIREVYWTVHKLNGLNSTLMSQLFWREFYYYITFYFPKVLKGKNYNPKYDGVDWVKSKTNFKKWCEGKTGYPVVDAGMRQLNETGYMHNRARLITANFLNRLLGYHWTLGEKYYATKLTDYDPAVNNGNWQWIASTGTDPKPYFQRLFNPIIQSEKFDPDAKYIKKWIPELENIPAKDLHKWESRYVNYNLGDVNYIPPIVNYKEARERSVKMYRAVL